MTDPRPDAWLTAEQVAEEWSQSVRWVSDKFASGEIPTVKVGRVRLFTPACRAALEASQLTKQTGSTWGRPTRGRTTPDLPRRAL